MKNRSLARFVVFALIQVLLCVLAFVFAAGMDSILTRIEARGTLIVILACTAVSVISSAIFGGTGCMVVALVLMIPQLLLSVLMYWLCIFQRSRR